MNFFFYSPKNAEARRLLKELHTKLVLQREKWLCNLIPYTEYVVKYTEFLNYTRSATYFNQHFLNFYLIGFTAQKSF